MTEPPKWGGPCRKCGHPASYHGMTFCTMQAGADVKRECDCDGYDAPYCECGWDGVANHYHESRLRGAGLVNDEGS